MRTFYIIALPLVTILAVVGVVVCFWLHRRMLLGILDYELQQLRQRYEKLRNDLDDVFYRCGTPQIIYFFEEIYLPQIDQQFEQLSSALTKRKISDQTKRIQRKLEANLDVIEKEFQRLQTARNN